MAQRLARDIGTDERLPQDMRDRIENNKDQFIEVVKDSLSNTGLKTEFTVLRLVEQIKDAIFAGSFGPMGPHGDRTDVGNIADMLNDSYTDEFLALFNEEGRPYLMGVADVTLTINATGV